MRIAWFVLLALSSSCAQLSQIAGPLGGPPPKPPRMTVADVALATHPTDVVIARALCPMVAPAPVCMILGGRPSAAELRIGFAVQIDVENPNAIPLPLVEALVAFTAFPGAQGSQNLGAICLSFCDDPARCPPRSDACSVGGPEIRTAGDFANAAAGFLIATAAGQTRLDNLRIRTLPANGMTRVTVALELDPIQLVNLLARLGTDSIGQVKRGQVPTFTIPYQVEGSAWVTVQSFGKLAAGFGPYQGAWQIR
jgi:hypothetical protein